MITQTPPKTIGATAVNSAAPVAMEAPATPLWKLELRNAVTSVETLLDMLSLTNSPIATQALLDSPFPLRVPLGFIKRMEAGNPDDPLLKQVLPVIDEEKIQPGFSTDPLAEKHYNPVPGIIHKYHGRVLLITTPVCAINCRYCFRRHFPYSDNNPGKQQWLASLAYISADSSISEVILSGGDPLATDDQHLGWLVSEIGKIPHVKRLRIHSRLPVVIPSRIDERCLAWMADTRLQLCMVLHINHSNEIDDDVIAAISKLRLAGVAVLNQSVLLQGVNDSVETLSKLSENLFAAGVIPYYLHLLDPVSGAGHFLCQEQQVSVIYRQLQSQLPGYLLPRLVRDIPGELSKVLIVP